MHDVRFYFDFISPYASLALLRAEQFATEHDVRWHMRPVLLSGLLDAHSLPGAGEVPAKRSYAAADMSRVAEQHGLPFVGPAAHPFLSLDALRTVIIFEDTPEVVRLCVELTRACWCEGRDLTEADVLKEIVRDVGLDPADLERRILNRTIKRKLRANTDAAVEEGVFGVPTFSWDGELFWGQDRMSALARRLAGQVSSPLQRAQEFMQRPFGFDRREISTGGS